MENVPTSLSTEEEKSSSIGSGVEYKAFRYPTTNVARRKDQALGLGKKKDAAAKKAGKKKRSLQKADDSEIEDDGGDDDKDSDESSETETEDEDSSGDGDDDDIERSEKSASKTKSKTGKKKEADVTHEGCVRLTKTDDPHWLSEMQCYVRSELVEVYSLKKKDSLDGYAGRKEPDVMQVGIRCVFCKTLPRDERSSGCIYFPDSLALDSDQGRRYDSFCTFHPVLQCQTM